MRYTEEQWKNIPERDSGLDWWNEPREVIVAWGDPSETPSETIDRLNSEAIEYQRKYKKHSKNSKSTRKRHSTLARPSKRSQTPKH